MRPLVVKPFFFSAGRYRTEKGGQRLKIMCGAMEYLYIPQRKKQCKVSGSALFFDETYPGRWHRVTDNFEEALAIPAYVAERYLQAIQSAGRTSELGRKSESLSKARMIFFLLLVIYLFAAYSPVFVFLWLLSFLKICGVITKNKPFPLQYHLQILHFKCPRSYVWTLDTQLRNLKDIFFKICETKTYKFRRSGFLIKCK